MCVQAMFRISPQPWKLAALPLVLWLAGCAQSPQEGPCVAVACLHAQTASAVRDQCMHDLSRYTHLTKVEQDRIEQTYRYPLTNAESYGNWVRMGGRGPSPWQWCRNYARARTAGPLAQR